MVSDSATAYIAFMGGKAVGFIYTSLRQDYVEGTTTSPVGYIEGIYVQAPYRQMGFASQLLQRAEQWTLENGGEEMGADTEIHNEGSHTFHVKSGFIEKNRIIY
jgi:aminoglycoside 6'-N-acetyltransferase I